jgi:hypothetical protein
MREINFNKRIGSSIWQVMQMLMLLKLWIIDISNSMVNFKYLSLNLSWEFVLVWELSREDLSTQWVEENVLPCVALKEVEEVLGVLFKILVLNLVL